MAYRRKQGLGKSTFMEETYNPDPHELDPLNFNNTSSSSSSLAAQAIKASAADSGRSKVSNAYERGDGKGASKSGFWGILAQKAKSMLDEDGPMNQFQSSARSRWQMPDSSADGQLPHQSAENQRRMDNPRIRKGLDKITTSLNQIGDTFEKAFEEGRTIVGNKTADIIQETRKLQIRRKGNNPETQSNDIGVTTSYNPSPVQSTTLHNQTNPETQLKASRDVAMATAAKAKLLLRELKTVKADLAFAKQRCAQLEEENKVLRESREKGSNPADDDLIRVQLETLLAEKARLAHENEVYSRENRFLREIVEYHQLTMQDVVYIDEGIEEVTEVHPIPSVSRILSSSPPSPKSPSSPELESSESPHSTEEMASAPEQPQDKAEVSESKVTANSTASAAEMVEENDAKSFPTSSV